MNDFPSAEIAGRQNGEAAPEPGADTAPASSPSGFRVTWARTPNNARIGKIQTPSGKWPPTSGAKSTMGYIFETKTYPGIAKYYADYRARLKSGCSTPVMGELRPGLDPSKPHRRIGPNFVNAASTKFPIDFDGLEPDSADEPIDSATAFAGDAYAGDAIFVALARLPEAFSQAACMVSATSSTGLKINSKGEPSEDRAWLRGTWETSRALTCRQQERFAKALKALPGLGCIDGGLYSLAHFEFAPRPVFLPGEVDPIAEPAYLLEGGLLDIDAACAELGIDLNADDENGDDDQSRIDAGSPGSGSAQAPKEELALDLPPEQAEPLLRALMEAIGNYPGLRDDYNAWFGSVAGLFGASRGSDWGESIATNWTASGDYDTAEVHDKWLALRRANDGRNGIDSLIKLAMWLAAKNWDEAKAIDANDKSTSTDKAKADAAKAKAAELETAVFDIERALAGPAADAFPDDEVTAEARAETEAKAQTEEKTETTDTPRSRWRAALEQLSAARPAPIFDAGGWIPHPDCDGDIWTFDPDDVGPVPLRPEMTDRHTRGEAAMLAGNSGVGKSSLGTSYAVAIAFENPAVIGQSTIDWCGDVVIVTNEETRHTVLRRIRALTKRLGLSRKDQKHRIHVYESRKKGPLILGYTVGQNGVAPTKEAIAFVNHLAKLNARKAIAYAVFDTLTSLFSGLNENSPQMDKAVGMIADMAKAGFFAADIFHHVSAAQIGKENEKAYRGSTSIGGKVREHSTIVLVPKDEWKTFGWSDAEGAHTIRVSGQKANDRPHAGIWCFRREFPSVTAFDVRNPDSYATVAICILVPLGSLKPDTQIALQALYNAHQKGIQIIRGGGSGPISDHSALRILIDAGLGSDRKKVEELIVQLIKEGLVTTQSGIINKKDKVLLIPSKPETLPPDKPENPHPNKPENTTLIFDGPDEGV